MPPRIALNTFSRDTGPLVVFWLAINIRYIDWLKKSRILNKCTTPHCQRSNPAQDFRRLFQRLVLLGEAKTDDGRFRRVAVERRQRDDGDALFAGEPA